ncbi:GrpB family protein [uncultured Paludibaculum sp.]|uniref:GrpB family protein n=1 Tax=uncultured Paludibaculum sp. TaxID=1765020 RepID=UPI002AAB582F|nr:GrpB family protein [uncultured Paludibaculum sp.]
MIGLKRHTLKVADHDPHWAALGAEACGAVRRACGELLADVQHVGSTAVPGLPAKPILDIAAAVATYDLMPDLIRRLADAGFRYRGDHGDTGGHLWVVDSPPDIRTIHLHVVEYGGSQWRDYVRFRDLLRNEPSIRNRYAALKRELARVCLDDRELYTASKADFIRDVLGNEVDWADSSEDESRGV